jgi:hypothetical protein
LGKKPKGNDQTPSKSARTINLVLLAVALIAASGFVWYAIKGPAPDTRAALPKPSTTTLDPAQFSGQTRVAYEAAKEVPEVLAQLPCFCGCMGGAIGHRNNLDCFHDHHGVECTMCQEIAIDARDWYKSGLDIDRIREKVKDKYGRYAALQHDHPPSQEDH